MTLECIQVVDDSILFIILCINSIFVLIIFNNLAENIEGSKKSAEMAIRIRSVNRTTTTIVLDLKNGFIQGANDDNNNDNYKVNK